MPNPMGISAGKPTAKTLRLGDAREITPKQPLIMSEAQHDWQDHDDGADKYLRGKGDKARYCLSAEQPAAHGNGDKALPRY